VNDAIRLLSRIPNWSVLHVKRNANEAAHALAKLALGRREEKIWRDNFPDSVCAIVCEGATI
jgi:hypothetical protein